jgi:hypothetical protein
MFTIARFESDFCYLGVTPKQMTDFFMPISAVGLLCRGVPQTDRQRLDASKSRYALIPAQPPVRDLTLCSGLLEQSGGLTSFSSDVRAATHNRYGSYRSRLSVLGSNPSSR